MKKFMFVSMVAAMTLFAAAPLFAEKMMAGVKGGVSIADFTGDDAEGFSSKMGFVGGGFFCYNISEVFGIQPELLYSMRGATEDDEEGEIESTLDYIEIPLLLMVNIPTEGKIKPMLYAGPTFSFLMSAEVESIDVKDYVKSTDIGILAGAGIGYKMTSGLLFIEGRYEVGFSSAFDLSDEQLEEWELTENPDAKNSVISVMLGYGFSF